MIGKHIKNYIERAIQQKIGINPNDREIKKIKNEVRSIRGNVSRMSKMLDSMKDLMCCKCNPKVKEKDG
jgi:5-bromo-4-chloroindolyl phosphate hydrolysis protein